MSISATLPVITTFITFQVSRRVLMASIPYTVRIRVNDGYSVTQRTL